MKNFLQEYAQPFRDFNQGRKLINLRLQSHNRVEKATEEVLYASVGVLLAEAGTILGLWAGSIAGIAFDYMTQIIPIEQSYNTKLAIVAPFMVAGAMAGLRQGIEWWTPQAKVGRAYRRRISG